MSLRPGFARFPTLLATLPLLGLAGAARATPSVDLVFTELNGLPIAEATHLRVAPDDQVTVEMRMTTDSRGVTAYAVSVDFDSALESRILLDAFANVTPPVPNFYAFAPPIGPEDTAGSSGFVLSFNAGTLLDDPATDDLSFAIGTLTFTATDGILGGPVVIAPGLFNAGIDEILSNELVLVGGDFEYHPVDLSGAFAFQSLTLLAIPEPSTALLLGAGLALLARTRRAFASR